MNFGDILDQWAKTGGNFCAICDKDAQEEQRLLRENLKKPQNSKRLPIEARIDLHGLTRTEALERLETFVAECKKRSLKKILIIHGKGNHSGNVPVLFHAVRSFISGDRRLGTSGHPGISQGGSGATWVIIKQ